MRRLPEPRDGQMRATVGDSKRYATKLLPGFRPLSEHHGPPPFARIPRECPPSLLFVFVVEGFWAGMESQRTSSPPTIIRYLFIERL